MQYHRYHQPAGSVRPQWRCHNNESVASDAAPPRPVARYKTCVLARNQQAVIPAARCGATDVASGFTPRQMSSICSDLSRRTVISFTHLSRLIRLSLSVCGQNYSNCWWIFVKLFKRKVFVRKTMITLGSDTLSLPLPSLCTCKPSKMFWKYISSRRKGRSDIGDLKSYDIRRNEVLITSDEDKANALEQFFSSAFTSETQTTYDTQDIKSTCCTCFAERNVLTKLENLKLTKCPGPDTLHPRIL